MVTSPFVLYVNGTAMDVRKAGLWSVTPEDPLKVNVYIRGTPEVPNQEVAADFFAAKQADCDASPFVR